jgi:hypothetical protein
VWIFTGEYNLGEGINQIHSTVTFPPGAEIVSVEPKPTRQFKAGAAPVVEFEARLGRNERWRYTIQYRLPPGPHEQNATPKP